MTLRRRLELLAAVFLAIGLRSPCLAGINQWTTQGPAAGRIDQIHVDPVNQATIYAVLPYGGIFKTINRGVGWRAVNRGIRLPVSDVAINPATTSVIYAGTYFGGGIFQSIDAAESWCEMGLAGFSVLSIAIDPFESGHRVRRDRRRWHVQERRRRDELELRERRDVRNVRGGD